MIITRSDPVPKTQYEQDPLGPKSSIVKTRGQNGKTHEEFCYRTNGHFGTMAGKNDLEKRALAENKGQKQKRATNQAALHCDHITIQQRSDNTICNQCIGNFHKTGNVGAFNIVDPAVILFAIFDTLIMNFLHDVTQ